MTVAREPGKKAHESLLCQILGITGIPAVIHAVFKDSFIISADKDLESTVVALFHFSDQKKISFHNNLLSWQVTIHMSFSYPAVLPHIDPAATLSTGSEKYPWQRSSKRFALLLCITSGEKISISKSV